MRRLICITTEGEGTPGLKEAIESLGYEVQAVTWTDVTPADINIPMVPNISSTLEATPAETPLPTINEGDPGTLQAVDLVERFTEALGGEDWRKEVERLRDGEREEDWHRQMEADHPGIYGHPPKDLFIQPDDVGWENHIMNAIAGYIGLWRLRLSEHLYRYRYVYIGLILLTLFILFTK